MLKRGRYWPWKTYRAALKVDWNEKRLPGKCMSCHARIHLSKFWRSARGGVGGLSLECDQKRNQKRDQANVKLRKLFPKILSQAEHEKFQPRFLLAQLRCFPCWLCLRQSETQRICLGHPSLPFPTEFFYPNTHSLYERSFVRWRHNQIFRHVYLCMGLRGNLDKVLFK